MDTGSQKLVTKEQTSFTELLDHQEAIILDLENLHYYALNAASSFLWKQLRAGTAQTAEELSAALAAAFEINAEQAEFDTQAFLDELMSHGLVSSAALEAEEKPRGAVSLPTDSLPSYQPPQLKASHSLSQVQLSGSAGMAGGAVAMG
jgi:hypothetical protein